MVEASVREVIARVSKARVAYANLRDLWQRRNHSFCERSRIQGYRLFHFTPWVWKNGHSTKMCVALKCLIMTAFDNWISLYGVTEQVSYIYMGVCFFGKWK